MHPLARHAVDYLHELGLPASAAPHARRGKSLPYFLTDAFEFADLCVADQHVLLAIEHGVDRTPAEAEKLIDKLREVTDTLPIYVCDAMTSYDRKRLIERRVPFLVPGNQLYLPNLGVDLREHFRQARPTPTAKLLSPSTQALLISALLRPNWTSDWAGADTAGKLGYTPMTASRAAREVAGAGLAKATKSARNLVLVFEGGPREIWTEALPLLRSPVLRTLFVRPKPSVHGETLNELRPAGLMALSSRTMLGDLGLSTFAMSRDEWSAQKRHFDVLARPGNGALAMQVWSYSAEIDARSDQVDPLSLYLSLRDEDPRVQSSLDELMEQVWR